jgi:cold shock protein
MGTGTLKIWNVDRGFGFIKDDAGGQDVFVHATTLRAARIDPETIKLGIRLAYEVEETPKPKHELPIFGYLELYVGNNHQKEISKNGYQGPPTLSSAKKSASGGPRPE